MTEIACSPPPPPRRIMAIWLGQLAIDRWRLGEACLRGEGADAAPHALIAETAHGPRITAVNAAASAGGVRPAMRLTDARALLPTLAVSPTDPMGDLALLERLALWARRWGPHAALDPPDGLLVDASAVAHLFGGEAALLTDVAARFVARGFSSRAAIAPTGAAAWALAHYGAERAILTLPSSLRAQRSNPERQTNRSGLSRGFAPRNDGEEILAALADLPAAALRLDQASLLVLRRLGLMRVGDLAARFADPAGRDALRRRFRARDPLANPLLRLDQLAGRRPEPLLPVVSSPPAMAQRRLAEPVRHRELLDRVLADLMTELAGELEARGEGARRLELALWRVDGEVVLRSLELASASRDAAHLLRLYAGKLDRIEAGFGIELARLTAVWSEPLALPQADLEAGERESGTTLAQFVDRLGARLGMGAVRRPVLHSSHWPERAQRWVPPLEPDPPVQEALAFRGRPLTLLDRAEPITVLYATPDGHPQRFRWRGALHDVVRVDGPERLAPEWWREKGSARLRDYYRIEDSAGRRYWIYRQGLAGDRRGGMPEWFLHGLCA